jgi:hypothetical protein
MVVAMSYQSLLLSWFYATLQPSLLILSLGGFKLLYWNYLDRNHASHGKFSSVSACISGFNSSIETSNLLTLCLVPAKPRLRSHKIPPRPASSFACDLKLNRTPAASLTVEPKAFPNAVASLQFLRDPHPTDPTVDNHSLCPVCDTPSTSVCPCCDQNFCSTHIYICTDCNTTCCGDCLDTHRADGHWSDSDTAIELAHGQYSGRGRLDGSCGRQACNSLNRELNSPLSYRLQYLAPNNHSHAVAAWIAPLAAFRSRIALLFAQLSVTHSGACL